VQLKIDVALGQYLPAGHNVSDVDRKGQYAPVAVHTTDEFGDAQ
jgi:hypothetical protein